MDIATYNWKIHNGKIEIISFLIAPHCQCQGVCQGLKYTHLYQWYPLFQAQCG